MLKITQIDAFTAEPFSGNPAAVCVLPAARDDAWMQNVAKEMNLSETAFLVRRPDGSFDLRWFTPAVEVALCGHATLASAHALWESRPAAARGDRRVPHEERPPDGEAPGRLDRARLSGDPRHAGRSARRSRRGARRDGRSTSGKSRFDYLIELDSERTVTDLRPDFGRLRSLPVRGVMVTSRATTPGWDFVSRFFAPGSGIDEDPVTGSAHCCLTPYWSRKLGRTELVARQVSPRGGTLRLALEGDRVKLRGQAVTVLTGELTRVGTHSAPGHNGQ